MFNFKKIAEFIENGACPSEGYTGEHKVDIELSEIDISVPLATPGAWISSTTRQVCNTIGDEGVAFTVRRWTRGNDRIDYWLAGGQGAHPDYLCAVRRGEWYLVVGCLSGHPFVQTPSVHWDNSDGSTDPVPLVYDTPDSLIAAAAATGRDYVRNQVH
jgi:hypothetical protein